LAVLLVLFYNIAGFVAETLGSGQGVDQRLCLDGAKPSFESHVEKAAAGLCEDDIGESVDVLCSEVLDDFKPAILDHLGAEIADGTLGDGR